MSSVPLSSLSKEQREELMCVYSSLILYDDNLDITQENILKLIRSSNGDIQPFTPMLFARAIKGKDLKTLFSAVAGGAGGHAIATPVAAGAGSATPAAAEEKKEEIEEEDDDMGFSLFD